MSSISMDRRPLNNGEPLRWDSFPRGARVLRTGAAGSGRFVGHGLDGSRDSAQHHAFQIDLAACVIDIDSDHLAGTVQIEQEVRSHLDRLGGNAACKIDIELVRLGVVVELRGLNFRSKNALRIVTPSSRVTTRRYPPPISSIAARWRIRLSPWCSRRTGSRSTRTHQSLRTSGRRRMTSFSKYGAKRTARRGKGGTPSDIVGVGLTHDPAASET